jgi:hypothetical protein
MLVATRGWNARRLSVVRDSSVGARYPHSPHTSDSGWRRPPSSASVSDEVEDEVEEDARVDERRDDDPDRDGASDAAAVERDGPADDAFVPSDVRERSSTRPGVGVASTPARAAAGSKSGTAGVDIAST